MPSPTIKDIHIRVEDVLHKGTIIFYVVRQLAYIHEVVLRCKDFHLSYSRFTISLMWYETPSILRALFET